MRGATVRRSGGSDGGGLGGGGGGRRLAFGLDFAILVLILAGMTLNPATQYLPLYTLAPNPYYCPAPYLCTLHQAPHTPHPASCSL